MPGHAEANWVQSLAVMWAVWTPNGKPCRQAECQQEKCLLERVTAAA